MLRTLFLGEKEKKKIFLLLFVPEKLHVKTKRKETSVIYYSYGPSTWKPSLYYLFFPLASAN